MGPLLRSCVEVREPIELSFYVVSGVGLGIDILDGVYMSHGAGTGKKGNGKKGNRKKGNGRNGNGKNGNQI